MSPAEAELGQASASGAAQSAKNSSRRRLWALGHFESNADALVSDPAYKEVEDACKDALVLWPNANAAVLYGSRARGDHRADSDWDLAFIIEEERSLPDSIIRVFRELRERSEIDVQAQGISQARFHSDADAIGSIAAPIAREGRLIAGHCTWPETERDPVLKPDEYGFYRCGALRRIVSAVENIVAGIDYARKGQDACDFAMFIRDSSDAAENFSIIAFARLASSKAYTILKRHQLGQTEEMLDCILEDDSGPCGIFWNSECSTQCRNLLRSMKVRGDKELVRDYPERLLNADVIDRAANRLVATASFAVLEVKELPDPSELRQAAREAAPRHWISMLTWARRLRKMLQGLDLNERPFAAANPALAESATAAASFGDEIAQAIEKLADSLYEELGPEERAVANPVVYVVGYGLDGKLIAIADDAETILNRADSISSFPVAREGAGLELLKSAGFDRALNALGFSLEPSLRKLVEAEALELVKSRKELDPDESALREALAKLLRERAETRSPSNIEPEAA